MSLRTVLLAALVGTIPTTSFGQSHQLVDVGSHRLDVVRAGAGSPAVILEAGLGNGLDDWDPVWPSLVQFSTVVAYSRSGNGKSEPGRQPHTARNAAVELHTVLAKLAIKPPYVLVGRSYGGLLVRMYTSLYPDDVAGVVLVDGTHEQQVKRWGTLDPSYPAAFRAYYDSVLTTKKPGAEAEEIRETVRIQAAGGTDGLNPLPDIPIAVLTSMRVDPAARYVNGTARGHELWREMHDEWFRRSHNGIHLVTTRSGHAIQAQEPELVVEAIRFVLDRVRTQ
jgi:pimeloyl-ACP methyl ester carboxylesterase